ncbi:MAG TPA: hypothetical protein VF316_23290 [Polyangiaceae bacterium]
MKRSLHLLLVGLLASCGYRPLYGGAPPRALHVHLSRVAVADTVVATEVERGAREALAREGALLAGDGYPRLEIEVLRIDETSEGVATTPFITPQARGTRLGVLARAYVQAREGAPAEADTGDMRTSDLVTSPLGDPKAELFGREDTLRAVARRLGQKLAGRAMGHPVPSEIEAADP